MQQTSHDDPPLVHLCELLCDAMSDSDQPTPTDERRIVSTLEHIVRDPSSSQATRLTEVFSAFDNWNPITFLRDSLSHEESENTVQQMLEAQSTLDNLSQNHTPREIATWARNASSQFGLGIYVLLSWMVILVVLCAGLGRPLEDVEMKATDCFELPRLIVESNTSASKILPNVTNYDLTSFEHKIAGTVGRFLESDWAAMVIKILVAQSGRDLADCLVHSEETEITLDGYSKHV